MKLKLDDIDINKDTLYKTFRVTMSTKVHIDLADNAMAGAIINNIVYRQVKRRTETADFLTRLPRLMF